MLKHALSTAVCCALFSLSVASVASGLAAEQVDVIDPYARAMPPVVPNSGAFLTLKNSAAVPHRLVSASSPAAQTVELHTHINDNGVMRMRQVDGIDIPANGITELKPGGLHIMLIGLHEPLVPGSEITLELSYQDGSSEAVTAPVRKIGMGGTKQPTHQ